MTRVLVVCADDLGASAGTNSGIARAHDHGIVTSASLMVHRAAAIDAATLARERPRLSVGLHLDLGEWVLRRGRWEPAYEVVRLDAADAVEAEVALQLERFRALLGHDPTHLDSHQHIHVDEPVRAPALRVANKLGIPLRAIASPARHCGSFYGQGSDGEACSRRSRSTGSRRCCGRCRMGSRSSSATPAVTPELDSPYRLERLRELQALCDPVVGALLKRERIELKSFAELPRGGRLYSKYGVVRGSRHASAAQPTARWASAFGSSAC